MQKLVIAFALLGTASFTFGQQYTPVPVEPPQSKAEALPKSLVDLEAAGLPDEASKIHAQADNAQPQVILRVRVFEISQTKLQNLGFDFSRVFGRPVQAESVVKVLDVLREVGVAKLLANPEIVAMSNHTASLQVGGHARVAAGAGGGRVSIEDKFYGTRVDFTPVVSTDKKIHVKLRIELSHPDEAHNFTVAGETAPILRSMLVDTTGDYKSGETVALGGLLSGNDSANSNGSDATAGTNSATNPQAKKAGDLTETLFLVTPEIVSPTTAKTAATAQTHR